MTKEIPLGTLFNLRAEMRRAIAHHIDVINTTFCMKTEKGNASTTAHQVLSSLSNFRASNYKTRQKNFPTKCKKM